DRRRWAELMRWGLIPSWADDPQVGARLINARAETVADKPAFRGPFRRSRCVIPADGFYEWHGDAGGRKQPYYIRRADGRALVFAGLWDEWSPPDGEPVRTCIIITVDAAAAVAQLHPRMPAMISPQQAEPWLDLSAEPERLGAVLGAPEAGELTFHAVSAKVNSPVHDAPDCIEPAESDRPRQGRLF
ncbi:MAG: SOS response-associated peptidase, partial [Planctomycetota bacterium]